MTAIAFDNDEQLHGAALQEYLHRQKLKELRDRALLALVALNVLDLITTTAALHNGAHEANPLMKPVAGSVLLLLLVKVLIVGYFVWIVRSQKRAKTGLLVATWVCGVYSFVVLNNIAVIISHFA